MSKVAQFPALQPSEAPNPRIAAMVSAILTLVDGFALTPQEQEQVLKGVTEKLRPISVPKAGDVLNNLIPLIPRNREWTVRELKRRLEEQGNDYDDKEIYNAIGYLSRKQHIQRVGPGKYIINGVVVVTADDLGGQHSITEGDHDD